MASLLRPPPNMMASASASTDQTPRFSRQSTPDLEHDFNHIDEPVRRLSLDHDGGDELGSSGLRNRYRKSIETMEQNISNPTSLRHTQDAVAPFLAKHIPMQYNPVGMASTRSLNQESTQHEDQHPRTSTRFCYRHQPGTKCRRQANEPDMIELQNELTTLSKTDQQAITHVWSLFSAAPAKHRELILQGLLTQCCFPQLSYISASLRDLIKIDFLSALPAELGFKILCYLDTTSLCQAAQVSQRWRTLADDDVVWHRMCEQHIDRKCTKCGWGLPLLERKRLRIEKRQIQLRATGRSLNSLSPTITPKSISESQKALPSIESALPSPASETNSQKRPLEDDAPTPDTTKKQCSSSVDARGPEVPRTTQKRRPWKEVYKDRFKVGTAWKHGRFSTQVFRGHTNGVMCVQADDKILISGSYDSTVKIWDVKTCQEIRTLRGHTSGIRCLQFDEKKLLTGSLDGTLRLWNWKTAETLRVFHAHEAGVLAVHFVDRYVASGSMDRTIRVWDSALKQTFLLRGHTDWVNSVKIDEPSRTLFSASDDLTVRVWDLDKKRCIQVFEGHVGQVQQVSLLPVEFELEERKSTADKDDDASSVSSMGGGGGVSPYHHRDSPAPVAALPYWPRDPDRPAPPRYMLTGALDSTIRLWDVHALQPVKNAAPSSDPSSTFGVLPTDPLTNSHIPRAASCVRTFFGHVEGIWALAADHLRMVSGSEDKMLKVWDPRTGKCERTFTGHAGPITCVWLSDSKIATGGEDCEVRMICFGET